MKCDTIKLLSYLYRCIFQVDACLCCLATDRSAEFMCSAFCEYRIFPAFYKLLCVKPEHIPLHCRNIVAHGACDAFSTD